MKTAPDITYIVSAFKRPKLLPVILSALNVQTNQNFECIVTDNAETKDVAVLHKAEVIMRDPRRFRYLRTHGKTKVSDCYWAAEYAVKRSTGRWLCFPCDDTYLVPEFGQRMLTAAAANGWEFVIDRRIVVGPEAAGGSSHEIWEMRPGRAIKTSFIVSREAFVRHGGFTGKPNGSIPVGADYFFSHVMSSKVSWGFVDEVMVVHL